MYNINNDNISQDVEIKNVEKSNQKVLNYFREKFNFIPEKYIKYFVMLGLHLISIIFFMIIYYLMMFDFDRYYFIPERFGDEHFKSFPLLIALFMSINFQTTTAYVDLKLKSLITRSVVMLQLCTTFVITFLILFE